MMTGMYVSVKGIIKKIGMSLLREQTVRTAHSSQWGVTRNFIKKNM